MKCSLCISNFLEETSSLSHSIVFLYFFIIIGLLFPWDPQKTGYKLTAPTHTYLDIFSAYNFICTLVGSLIVISESESHSVVSSSLRPHGLYSQWNSPDQNTGVGSLSFLQQIFPTQELNWSLLHCRWILYQLSQQESPRIWDWLAYPFSSRSSRPRNWTGVSSSACRFFTSWAMRETELTHWKRPWCWKRLRAGGEGSKKGWDGWMASPT